MEMNGSINPSDLLSGIAGDAGSKWNVLFINYEYQSRNGEVAANSWVKKIIKPLFGKVVVEQFSLTAPTRQLAMKFSETQREKAGSDFLTLDILMWKDGKFKIFLDFDNPPRRINGDVLFNKQHLKYLEIEPLLSEIG